MTRDDVPLDAAERKFSELHGPFDSNAHLRAERVRHPEDCGVCKWAAEAERYQGAYHEAVETQGRMTSAASMAAATTVMAIEQAQHYRAIVDAGVEWLETRERYGKFSATTKSAARTFNALLRQEHSRRKNAS